MSAKTTIWILAGVVTAGAIGVAWRLRRVVDGKGVAIAELHAKQTALGASLQKRQADIAKNETLRAELQAAVAKLKPATPVASKEAPPPRMLNLTSSPMEMIAKDPKLQVLYLASKRASVAASYGPLFRKLGLSPEQIDRLAVAMTKAEELKQDAAAIQRDRKLPADEPGLVALRQQATDELAATQLAVLGADGAEQLRQYQRTMPARAIVDRLAGAAVLAGLSLTANQADQLTQAMAHASSTYQGSTAPADMARVDWDAVDAHAAKFLSPEQLALFKRIEPPGGGVSRWNARFDRMMEQALKPSRPSGG
jgi:hypothetical protein